MDKEDVVHTYNGMLLSLLPFNSNYIVIWVGWINNAYKRQMLTMKEESLGARNNA